MVPMMAISQVKRNYNNLDLADWVRYWNAVNAQDHTMDKSIQLRFPDLFPIRSPTLLRCAIVDPKCVPAICKLRYSLDFITELDQRPTTI